MYPYSLQEVGPDLTVSRGYVDQELPSTVPAEIIQEHIYTNPTLHATLVGINCFIYFHLKFGCWSTNTFRL